MNVVIKNKVEMDQLIAEEILQLIRRKPNCILGLATGSSPIGVYQKLIDAYKNQQISFSQVKSFNLDEYVGLDENHPQSYRYFMNVHLFDQIDISRENTHVPSGIGEIEHLAEAYDKQIAAEGGIDLQLLGIGSDGHIAFNEPGTSFSSLTHIAQLAPSTISDNSRFFASVEEVPTQAVTMGLKSIMQAKKIILMALGQNKAQAIYHLLHGPVTEEVPCSILQRHPDVTIYVDEEAYALCKGEK